MGNQSRNTVRLYASQTEAVWQVILKDGVAHSRAEYVRRKYGESAPVFLTAYQWYVAQAQRLVPKPEGAEFPYWVFHDPYLMESGYSSRILTLEVPVEEAVFFDMNDWNKVVRLKYIGRTDLEERLFQKELDARGINSRDVMLTDFYPDLKQLTLDSWQRLFRHHEAARQGNYQNIGALQAGLWRIRKEWVVRVNGADFSP